MSYSTFSRLFTTLLCGVVFFISTPRAEELETRTHIAVLLPFSGTYEAIGNMMWDAMTLALFDHKKTNLTLLPYDTKGTTEGAGDAMQQAVKHSPALILGPLFMETTQTALALKGDTPLLSFSNAPSLSGNEAFTLGIPVKDTISSVLNFAKERGIGTFQAIIPDTKHHRPLRKMIRKTQDSIVFHDHLPKASPYSQSTRNKNAILIPFGGEALTQAVTNRLIGEMETLNRQYQLLGSGEWDDPSLEPLHPRLNSAWYATTPLRTQHHFDKRFEQQFDYTPLRIASLGADAVTIAAELAETSCFTSECLTRAEGFDVINGPLRFMADGRTLRRLDIVEITELGVVTIQEGESPAEQLRQ